MFFSSSNFLVAQSISAQGEKKSFETAEFSLREL